MSNLCVCVCVCVGGGGEGGGVGGCVRVCVRGSGVGGWVLKYVPNGPKSLGNKVLSILKKISSLLAKITL